MLRLSVSLLLHHDVIQPWKARLPLHSVALGTPRPHPQAQSSHVWAAKLLPVKVELLQPNFLCPCLESVWEGARSLGQHHAEDLSAASCAPSWAAVPGRAATAALFTEREKCCQKTEMVPKEKYEATPSLSSLRPSLLTGEQGFRPERQRQAGASFSCSVLD